MPPASFVRIAELPAHIGQQVLVRAWVTHLRSSGKIAFAVLRDGTGICQSVLVKNQLSPEVWARFAELTTETSVEITGEVRAEARAPGGFEIGVTDLTIVGASPSDYPKDNFYPASIQQVGFVDPEKGDYRLTPSSKYKKLADGKDIGCDIDALAPALKARLGGHPGKTVLL